MTANNNHLWVVAGQKVMAVCKLSKYPADDWKCYCHFHTAAGNTVRVLVDLRCCSDNDEGHPIHPDRLQGKKQVPGKVEGHIHEIQRVNGEEVVWLLIPAAHPVASMVPLRRGDLIIATGAAG